MGVRHVAPAVAGDRRRHAAHEQQDQQQPPHPLDLENPFQEKPHDHQLQRRADRAPHHLAFHPQPVGVGNEDGGQHQSISQKQRFIVHPEFPP